MTSTGLGVDFYQLSTLVAHADAGRLDHRVSMAFFFRELPRERNYVVFCGLRSLLEHACALRIAPEELEGLMRHPVLGPALAQRPALVEHLASIDGFEGEISALPEGTLAFAGPGACEDGAPFEVDDLTMQLYTPLLQVTTDLVRAKLIETPWLGRINHSSMVASKAARIVTAAGGKRVVEFGARRTHPDAALDASYAAYLAGCAGSSNVAAYLRFGIPVSGTMDHFAVQAAERPGQSNTDTEVEAFRSMAAAFPGAATLIVDTYDTQEGVRNAVLAAGPNLAGIRLDSSVTREAVVRARRTLDEMGAQRARILVSDRMDERRIRELAECADGFGVGENITCSPDSSTGIGAVAKLVVSGHGKATMKLSRGSGKATLPGLLQVWRTREQDRLALFHEAPPREGAALLRSVWRGRAPLPLPPLEESRDYLLAQLAALPPEVRSLEPCPPRKLVASPELVTMVRSLAAEARSWSASNAR